MWRFVAEPGGDLGGFIRHFPKKTAHLCTRVLELVCNFPGITILLKHIFPAFITHNLYLYAHHFKELYNRTLMTLVAYDKK